MCLDIDSTYHSGRRAKTPIVTKQPLLVWKFVKVTETGKLLAPYQSHFEWKPGKLHTAKLGVQNEYYHGDGHYVEEGLHACITQDKARRMRWTHGNYRVVPCVIPEGSKVFLGLDDEIVSNQMIVYASLSEFKTAYNLPLHKGVGLPVYRGDIGKKPR